MPNLLSQSLMQLHATLRGLLTRCGDDDDRAELAGYMDRCMTMAAAVSDFVTQAREHSVYWVESDGPNGAAERLAPYAAEIAHYRLGEMVPVEGLWLEETGVDWKNVWDNYLEGYHFATGHPGLSDLMGQGYDYASAPGRTGSSSRARLSQASSGWCAAVDRRYCQRLAREASGISTSSPRARPSSDT